LDRLGWAVGFSIRAYGVRIGFRANSPAALEGVAERLPPGWKPSSSPVVDYLYSIRAGESRRPGTRAFDLLYADAGRVARTMVRFELLEALEANLHLTVAALSPTRIFVHAGVVDWRGKAVLIPGRSFTGKSTLVAELLRSGARFYSDEFAVLDESGRVHPFPRPLSLRRPDAPPIRPVARELGARTGKRPLPVGLVLVTDYREGRRWRPRRLSPGQAALSLLANTVPAQLQPERSLRFLTRAVQNAEVYRGARGEASGVVGWLARRD
jgi:hypothetical protein